MARTSWKHTTWLALAACFLLPGCPEQHRVEVRVKAGAAADLGEANPVEATSVAGYGSFRGVVTFEGELPQAKVAIKGGDASIKDSAVCAAVDQLDESLEVNSANRGIHNVVLYLEKAPAHIKPELVAPPSEPVFFDQKGCRFLPRVTVFRLGQPLKVLSDDPIPHNTHTDPKRNAAFNQTIAPGDRVGVECQYKKPEAAPVKVVCDYHAWMKAYHFPLDHPYFAKTDQDGRFRIEGLPAGKHSFNIWHESASGGLLERKVTVEITVDGETEMNFSFAPAKFAAVSHRAPSIAFDELQRGGEVHVTHLEKQ